MIKLPHGSVPDLKVALCISSILIPKRTGILLILSCWLLAACSLNEAATDTPSLDVTQAYQTVESRLTQATVLTPTLTGTVSPNPAQTQTAQSEPNSTTQAVPQPSASKPGAICDKAAPGFPMIDVNVEDGTEMEPGQKFTKIWRLTNAGTCIWTHDYQAVWWFGTKMGETIAVPLVKSVPPGDSVEIEVEMVAPTTPGVYRSDWKLMNNQGETFGIGPTGNSTFWVQIQVVQPPTTTPAPTILPTETPQPAAPPDETATPPPEAQVRVFARLTVVLSDTIDLDNGQLNPESGADLSYLPDDFGNHWITPINGTILGVYGNNPPSRDICQLTTMSPAPIAVGSISPGTFLCYQTDLGLPGRLQLIAYFESDSSIEIELVAWEPPE